MIKVTQQGLHNILLIALAGGIGALSRYGISRTVNTMTGSSFPWGTLAVNILGCFLCGLIWGMAENKEWLTERVRIILVIGFLGAFTTFSSFAFESLALIRAQQWSLALLNVAVQNTVGIAAVFGGVLLTRMGA